MAARLFAAVATLAIGFGQWSASWHEATVQHVRCAEHGELTHVALGSAQRQVPALDSNTIAASDVDTVEAHEHCGFVLAPQAATRRSVVRTVVALLPPPIVPPQPADPAPRPGRLFVLASAPKTSPPSV